MLMLDKQIAGDILLNFEPCARKWEGLSNSKRGPLCIKVCILIVDMIIQRKKLSLANVTKVDDPQPLHHLYINTCCQNLTPL